MVDDSKRGESIFPHQQLKAARIHQDLTCSDVAAALNLSVSTISILEAGEFEKLHGEAFVTGYMRSYSKFLSFSESETTILIQSYLDSASVVNAIERYQEPQMFNARITQWFQHKQYKTGYGLAAAITLIAILGFFSANDVNKPQPAVASDDIHLQTETGTTVISSVQKLPSDNPTQDILPTISISEAEPPFKAANNLGTSPVMKQNYRVAHSNLSFQFSADCWVEILDGDDKVIYASLQKSQQQLKLSGKPPFRITLGYAPGVELSYNGQLVDLTAENADLVKLVLGNS